MQKADRPGVSGAVAAIVHGRRSRGGRGGVEAMGVGGRRTGGGQFEGNSLSCGWERAWSGGKIESRSKGEVGNGLEGERVGGSPQEIPSWEYVSWCICVCVSFKSHMRLNPDK